MNALVGLIIDSITLCHYDLISEIGGYNIFTLTNSLTLVIVFLILWIIAINYVLIAINYVLIAMYVIFMILSTVIIQLTTIDLIICHTRTVSPANHLINSTIGTTRLLTIKFFRLTNP